ncbi:hypothetical protein OIU84_012727 [Salix udensis]|uniref:Uncharacterized protein n=1 Tax=Salix udensis TaxID=889485 RepID=A0AAD6JGH6_9ROSI|nr:hypothetical protein OIU84_012727 [Salix udensis]
MLVAQPLRVLRMISEELAFVDFGILQKSIVRMHGFMTVEELSKTPQNKIAGHRVIASGVEAHQCHRTGWGHSTVKTTVGNFDIGIFIIEFK